MKELKDYILEKCSSCEEEETECKNCSEQENEETEVKNEEDFRNWAKSKFQKVFKDDFDETKMKDTIDGFLKDHKDLVDKGEWGELIGIMNASFAN